MTCTNVHTGVYIKVYTLYIYIIHIYIYIYIYTYIHILGWICVFHDSSNDVCVRVEYFFFFHNDYMPKGVQEKRTEVLENKVDRMRMSNAFSE